MTIPLRLRWELAVRDDENLSPTAKLLGYTLRSYMNAHGECFVGVPRLARAMHLKPRAVQYARAQLEAADLLDVVKRAGHSNIYRLRVPVQFDAPSGASGVHGSDAVWCTHNPSREPAT